MESYRIEETSSGQIKIEGQSGVLSPMGSKDPHGADDEDMEPLSQIIEELNERFGLNLGPEDKITLAQIMDKLEHDVALEASARVNTRENVRLSFNLKFEDVFQEFIDTNFDLYKRVTDNSAFANAVVNSLFEQFLRQHREVEELITQQESKTLEFKSTLRWDLKEDRKDDKNIIHATLKTIAAFLNTNGGDLVIGVSDSGEIVGIEHDKLDTEDKFMRHLMQAVRNGLGAAASTLVDPRTKLIDGKTVCLVSCAESPEPVHLKWKKMEKDPEGDFYVRSGPGTVPLPKAEAEEYIKTRFGGP